MSDAPQSGNRSNLFQYIGFAIIGLYIVLSLVFTYKLGSRIEVLEAKQAADEEKLQKKIAATQSLVKEANESLTQQMGVTQKEIARRASELQRQQKQAETRLSEEQQKQQAALGEVSGAVAGVKTDVGGVKTDVAATKNDLEATKMKLDHAIGDLGQQSGLIATTREELEYLKHRGDRNYYEFTLHKSKTTTPVSTVSLQLKKADAKKNRFTLSVLADDRSIEKKDKTLNEPLQFITGRDKMLYELVVYSIEKDKITGYISTPKTAPQPVSR